MSSSTVEKNPNPSKGRDLRQELIQAGLDILAEDGLAHLTLRRVAARVGVSHAAPAHHFRGLPHLLDCIRTVGFETLTSSITTRCAATASDPRAQLLATCEGYIAFAKAHPDLTQLMFTIPEDVEPDAELREMASESYRQLQDACAPFEPISDADEATETFIWSLVHGYALLQIGGGFKTPTPRTKEPKFAEFIAHLRLKDPNSAN